MKFSKSYIRSVLVASVLALGVTGVCSSTALADSSNKTKKKSSGKQQSSIATHTFGSAAPTFVNLQILMEGAADYSTNMMRTNLWNNGLLNSGQNLQSPCRDGSTHQINLSSSPSPQTTPVDLVCVEIREETNPLTAQSSFVGIVQANGMIRLPNGKIPIISLDHSINYYVVVLHKSHLPIASELKSINNSMLYVNFRSEPTGSFGGIHQTMVGGGWAMFAGNTDQGGYQVREINSFDRINWSQSNGMFNQYLSADVNLDGSVDAADRILITTNNGLFTNIPFM